MSSQLSQYDRASIIDPITRMTDAVSTGRLPWRHEIQQSIYAVDPRNGQLRQDFAFWFSYGIPCQETIAILLQLGPLVELGCGNGFWAYWLRRSGCDIAATDPLEPGHYNQLSWTGDTVQLDALAAVAAYSRRNLLVVWPRNDSDWPRAVLDRMTSGQTLCYVGDCEHGCCASTAFFEGLRSPCFRLVRWAESPCWPLTRDYLSVHQRV